MTHSLRSAEEILHECLARVCIRAWRLEIDTGNVPVTIPLLRGVWGAALHDCDPGLYESLFEGGPSRVPGYVIRPAPATECRTLAVEFLLLGRSHFPAERSVWNAWELALDRGLGPARRRARLARVCPLAWDGTPLAPGRVQPGFALAPLPWPGESNQTPCRLVFATPARLIRDGRLIEAPTLADLAVAALRRLETLMPREESQRLSRREWIGLAGTVPAAPWRGDRSDVTRYSARQREEIEMHGVLGELELPHGPGPLADLLQAAAWIHLGKSSVMGLGQLTIQT